MLSCKYLNEETESALTITLIEISTKKLYAELFENNLLTPSSNNVLLLFQVCGNIALLLLMQICITLTMMTTVMGTVVWEEYLHKGPKPICHHNLILRHKNFGQGKHTYEFVT